MRSKLLLALVLGVLLPAPVPSSSAQGSAAVEPVMGLWKYSEFEASTNTCKSKELVSNGDGTFVLSRNEDGSLKIHAGDGTEPFDCTLKGSELHCPNRASASYDLRPTGVDAVLVGKGTVQAQFTDAKHLSGEQVLKIDCQGSACVLAALAVKATFPCEVTLKFEARSKAK